MERFGLTLPLRNQYFIMRVGQNFSEKGGKLVSNPETCVLDWPITEVGREQAIAGLCPTLEATPGKIDGFFSQLQYRLDGNQKS